MVDRTTVVDEQSRPRDAGHSHAVLLGRVALEPEPHKSQESRTFTSPRIAVNDGTDASFFDVVLFDRLTEVASGDLRTGSRLLGRGPAAPAELAGPRRGTALAGGGGGGTYQMLGGGRREGGEERGAQPAGEGGARSAEKHGGPGRSQRARRRG